jgi:hypothetical protein
LRRLADNRDPGSLASRLRQRRNRLLRDLLAPLARPLRVLDVGGTQRFWEIVEPTGLDGVRVVLLNQVAPVVSRPGFEGVAGDARDLGRYADGEFDLVFSNSVIEHVGDLAAQRRMADEVRRVGRRWFVQTPNRYFPLEPHFLVPGFQFLPLAARAGLARRFALGWYPRQPDAAAARALVESIRLLDEGEVRALFPGATIRKERLAGLTKSFMAYGGF